jgi:hypothetical protein
MPNDKELDKRTGRFYFVLDSKRRPCQKENRLRFSTRSVHMERIVVGTITTRHSAFLAAVQDALVRR